MKPEIKCIHVIEHDKRNYLSQLGAAGKVWESGFWPLTEADAKPLIGGSIFFHKKKSGPSFCGGLILDCRIRSSGEWAGLVIFTFEYRDDHGNVWTDDKGWKKDMKIAIKE
ncbi:MAG: hypothetical protein WCS52_01020 [bacterium]